MTTGIRAAGALEFDRMSSGAMIQFMDFTTIYLQALQTRNSEDSALRIGFDAGAKAGLEELRVALETMFSDEGLGRAIEAYKDHAEAEPAERMRWTIAAALDATQLARKVTERGGFLE